MFENYTLITAAFVLPLFGVYFFLFTPFVSSTNDEQRQLLTGPRWMAAVNTLTVIGTLFVFAKIESQLGRLLAVAGGAALLSVAWLLHLRRLRRRGVNPSLLSKLNRLNLLAALSIALS